MNKYLQSVSEKFVSKWLILLMDIIIVCGSFVLASFIKFNFDLNYIDPNLFKYHLIIVVVLRISAFFYFKTYTGIIRHTSIEDAVNIFKATSISSLELIILNFIDFGRYSPYFHVPIPIILIGFFIVSVGLIFSRIMVKNTYTRLLNSFKVQKKVLIYGAGHLGRISKNTLQQDKRLKYEILAYIDDNSQLIGKTIEGTKVISRSEAIKNYLNKESKKLKSVEVVFAIQGISSVRKNEIIDELLETGVTIKLIPPVRQWMNGELSSSQIKTIKIEDLLERDPITLNNRLVSSFLKNKTILVTGAAGSIGSEIVKQVIRFEPKKVILLDQAESGLYDLETELTRLGNQTKIECVSLVGSVLDRKQMKKVFENENPNVVFHAAAYKHVPLMEAYPNKAIEVNVLGTKNMSDLSLQYKVDRFVLISTDKAVNPTNVMGATKRLAEMYVQSLNVNQNKTRFITTRFGNVLGSNGSVIPLFKRQIEEGGPITVTDKRIIRYFMTIPEACQLVLEAGTMGKGGEIFVFEMGEPVRIYDLAKRMIKLSGLQIGQDIEIKITGLRPGEKLYEELLNDAEATLPTHHPKIMIAKVKSGNSEEISNSISLLGTHLHSEKKILVAHLKSIVPEYISQNSEFESLDLTDINVEPDQH
ncbi:NDP-sugar epimerase, includes UDP-GlcNAc-inverting 4,6-dehydratase FlaA1 and capsular polysaccharide biosynthesis protein EpsC [Spirosomataceae bacterium TFI 002]|nr:NDP-sugar epimerase, includes UDP-GlcNAc-inverting 4,6-dehydratase FlaA1 and capsular polysaccharide biosynthesis protein EpsC [Spirosomataceae bacterium TFI 002]